MTAKFGKNAKNAKIAKNANIATNAKSTNREIILRMQRIQRKNAKKTMQRFQNF